MSTSPKKIEIILVDPQAKLCDAWKDAFFDFPEVQVVNGYFQDVKEFDCMVSPANSFGLMDGGVDLVIRSFFGMKLQYEVQKRIKKEYFGEQPVGTSMIVYTENEKHPFLAHTPTMRVPMDISKTDNVYNAFFALLRAVTIFNREVKDGLSIKKVLCPGLGTATGKMDLKEATRQMAVAYRNFLNPTTNMRWPNLFERNNEILGVK